MEINVSMSTHAYLLLAKTLGRARDATMATHAPVYQAFMEVAVVMSMHANLFLVKTREHA